MNSRLDEIQAAILRARLPFLPRWTETRRSLAARYRRELACEAIVIPPALDEGHVYHLFPVLSPERERTRARLEAAGIETLIHYPIPIPRQTAVRSTRPAMCPVADRISSEVFSLPLYPAISEDAVAHLLSAVRAL